MTPENETPPVKGTDARLLALEAEVVRLRAALASAGLDASKARAATADAEATTHLAQSKAATAASSHTRDMAAGRAELADTVTLNARLQDLNDELHAREERLHAVIESATDHAIIEMNFDGRVTGWSPGAERVFGWTAAEAIGQDGAVIWTPEDRAAGEPERERKAADAAGTLADDRWHVRRDGTRFWGSGHLTPLRNGHPRGYLKVLRDRTAARRAEEVTRASEERFRALATAGTYLVYRMSADWRWMHQLDGRDILADTPEPISDWADRYILPEDRPAVWTAIEDAIRKRSLFELEHRVRRADGSVGWVLSRAVPILGPNGEVVEWFGAGTDVTARREADEHQAFLLRLTDALRPLTDPVEVQRTAMRLLADHLSVIRASYFEMDVDEDWFTQAAGHEDDVIRLPARMRMSDYGPDIVAAYRSSRPLAVADIEADTRFEAHRDTYRAIGVRAWAGVPLIKDGQLVAVLAVHSPVSREWKRGELQLLEEVAQRSWAAVELARVRRRTADINAFLVRFSESVRGIAEPQAVAVSACRLVAETLGVERAYWAEVDWATRDYAIGATFHLPDVPVIAGRFTLDDWEPFTSLQLAGRPTVVNNAQEDACIPPAMKEDFARLAIGAELATPVIADGRLRSVLAVNQRLPRRWTPEEVALVQGIAGRCWAEVERTRAEVATRESEARYRALFESMDEAYAVVEVLRGANGVWRDFRFVEVNPAFMTHTSMPYPVGRTASELLGTPNPRWTQLYGQALDTGVPLRVQESEPTLGRVFDLNVFSLDRDRNRVAVLFDDITQRVHAEAALRASEARLAATLEALPVGVGVVDAEGAYVLSNRAMDRFMPTKILPSRDTVRGWRWRAWHPDGRPVEPRDFPGARALRGDRVVPGIEFLHHAEGDEEIWTKVAAVPLKDVEGRITGVVNVVSDIDAVKRGTEALRASEARFRGFAENSADVLWITDGEGKRLEYLSPAFERMYGEGRDRVMADLGRFMALVHPEDREAVAGMMPRALAGEVAIAHYRVVRPSDGQITHLRDTGFPIRDETGAVTRVAGVVQDVNDIVQATEALEAEKERFRTLAEGIPQLVWRSAADGEWTWASPQWTAFTGLSDAESRGSGWLQAVHPDDRDPALAAWDRAGANGVFEADYRICHVGEGRWRWFQTRGMPVQGTGDGSAVEWLGASTDVDDQIRTREALARNAEELEARIRERTGELMAAEESLRQAQKMEAVGRLTGGIAHDFNNMLQGVAGGVDMARRRVEAGRAAEARRYLDAAREAVDRAAGLTRRLLTFARRQRLEPKPVDADGLVAGMTDLIRRTVGPGIELSLRLRDGTGVVLCDPNELESALLNLCINARDAMPEGGQLMIGTDDVDLLAADIPGGEVGPGRYMALTVMDSGMGMPPEVLARAFEPFFTTKPMGQGTGLGLSQVWGFARQAGGLVKVESTLGRGTTFRVLLPFHARPTIVAAQPVEMPTPAPRQTSVGRTVLLVDDEGAVRGPAADRLRELGYAVLEAEDGPAALRILASVRPDLLVTDVGLPGGMNGRQVAEAARERWPRLPVLFITGYAGSTVLPSGIEVIDKPFALDDLARRVAVILKVQARQPDRDPEV